MSSSPEVDKEKPTRIWVGGLESRTTEQHLEDVFGEFGPVTEVRIRSTTRDVFAFVQFTKHGDASKAVKGLNQSFVRGKRVKVAWAEFKPKRVSYSRSPPPTSRRKSRSPRRRRSPSRERHRRRNPSPRFRRRSPSPRYRRRRSRSYRRERSRSPYSRKPRGRGYSSVPQGDFKIELENIPEEMSWMDLKSLGRKYAEGVTFARTWQANGKQCGLLEYSSRRDMQDALEQLDGSEVEGKIISAKRQTTR